MARTQVLQDATGVLLADEVGNAVLVIGLAANLPADGAKGFAGGCLFIATDGGRNLAQAHFINIGTSSSADFDQAIQS